MLLRSMLCNLRSAAQCTMCAMCCADLHCVLAHHPRGGGKPVEGRPVRLKWHQGELKGQDRFATPPIDASSYRFDVSTALLFRPSPGLQGGGQCVRALLATFSSLVRSLRCFAALSPLQDWKREGLQGKMATGASIRFCRRRRWHDPPGAICQRSARTIAPRA